MAGFAFYIGDEQLLIGAKTKISISIESILLSEKTIAGAVSFPFNVANNAHNRRLLNISNTLMTFDEYQNVKCKSYLGGNFWKNGFIVINNHDLANINISFTEFNSEEDFDNNFLKDLNLPTIQPASPGNWGLDLIKAAVKERAENIYPNGEKDFICPTVFNIQLGDITNPLPVDENSSSNENKLNEQNKIYFQNLYENDNYFIYTGVEHTALNEVYRNKNLISPFFYVNYIIKNLFAKLNLSVSTSKLKSADLDYLIVYNSKGFLFRSHAEYFATIRPPFVLVPQGTLNSDIRYFKFADFMPNINFTDFLTGIKSTFNLIYIFDYINNNVKILCKNDILKSAKAIDISNISEPFTTVKIETIPKQPYGIFYAQKDDSIIDNTFELKGYSYKGIVNQIADLPINNNKYFDLYTINEIVTTKDYYLMYYWAENNTWTQLPSEEFEFIRPYSINLEASQKEQKKLELKSDTFVTRVNTREYINALEFNNVQKVHYFCPAIDTTVQYEYHNARIYAPNAPKENISSLHLLFYRGKVENSNAQLYPFANRNRFLPVGINNAGEVSGFSQVSTQHSLEIDGPDGLYEKFYKEWIVFLASLTRLLTYNVRFSPAQIVNDDLFLNEMQISGKRFIISKLTITGDANQIEPCKTEMYQIEPK